MGKVTLVELLQAEKTHVLLHQENSPCLPSFTHKLKIGDSWNTIYARVRRTLSDLNVPMADMNIDMNAARWTCPANDYETVKLVFERYRPRAPPPHQDPGA
ncbi:hypothetical protein HY493_05450 [Candidatus Woesearchaeota archaeon]|nr:hypothetical protein [Candidatus Woesearchaeota archaeon]